MTPEELRQISKQNQEKIVEKAMQNTNYAVKYFLKDLETYAKMGRYERKTTCLVHKKDKQYWCQTENDGNGFEVYNIDAVIKSIRALGFTVNFVQKKGYCPLTIGWSKEWKH